ncbi:MAG TPA: hypothetical protein VFO11_08100 [Candidatus Polarisedimenticolaceae bacterium]|nr:hypothetical protein [Candidatus Polarisedimenticolaceae bacterium]
MVHLRFEVMPVFPFAHPEVAGAIVHCWVDTSDPMVAEARARGWLGESGWVVVSLEASRLVHPEDDLSDAERLHVEQARSDGGSMRFHTWPTSGEFPTA